MNNINKKMEMAREAEGCEMRRAINFHSDMCSKEKEVSVRSEQRDRQESIRRMTRREYAAWQRETVRNFLSQNIVGLVFAAILFVLDMFSLVDFAVVLVGAILIGVYLSVSFMVYAGRLYEAWEANEDGQEQTC